jgi:hypothetical protein
MFEGFEHVENLAQFRARVPGLDVDDEPPSIR